MPLLRTALATMATTAALVTPADARPCGLLVRGDDAIGVNDGNCGTVASQALDEQGRYVAGECSYDVQRGGGTLTVTVSSIATAQRVLPAFEDPLGRVLPVALTTRCVLRDGASGRFVVDVQGGPAVTTATAAHIWTATASASSVPFTVCVEVTAVWGDFDAAWTPLACLPPA